MNDNKKIIIILVTIILFLILNPIRIKYFTDKGKLSRYLLEVIDGRAPETKLQKLEKDDIEILLIQRNNGFNIYYYIGYGDFVNDGPITIDCYNGLQLSSGHNNGGSRLTYSTYYMYGIKGNEVYTIEHLLYKKIIDPDSFLKEWAKFREKNKILVGVRECY